MHQRTDRILLSTDPTPAAGISVVCAARPVSAAGEIWVGDLAQDVPAPRPSRSVVVRGRRRYFG
jgi:hypothetical protein